MSSKKRKRSCPFASAKKSPHSKMQKKAEMFQKQSIRIGLMRLLASDKGSCFEQERLLALDEENIGHSLSNTSLALSPFEAVTITSQLNRYLVGFLYVAYECPLSLPMSSQN